MKKFKKPINSLRGVFLAVTSLIVAFTAGCSSPFSCGGEQKTYNLFDNEKWLTNGIYEVCTYGIEYKKPDSSEKEQKTLPVTIEISPESYLKTTLSWGNYGETPCFVFETELKVKGTYSSGSETDKKVCAFEDSTTSKTYFLKDRLSPLYSEKTVKNTTPYSSNDGYAFAKTNYSYTCSYDKSANKVTVVLKDLGKESDDDLYYSVKDSTRTYDNYDNNFVDNDLLLVFPRACALEEGYNHTFKTLDVLSTKIHDMRIAVSTTAPSFTFVTPADYTVNGETHAGEKFNAHNVDLTINSTFSGSGISLGYYSAEKDNYRLLTLSTEYAYGLGSLNYSLKTVISK